MNIYCVMGLSASGKDTIVNKVTEMYDIKKVIPITTRPKRENEINGIDYFFYDNRYLKSEFKNVVAVRCYKVWNGKVWTYAFDRRAFEGENDVILAVDALGFKQLKETFTTDNVVPIFLSVSEQILIDRLLERNTSNQEIVRRFNKDIQNFIDYFESAPPDENWHIIFDDNIHNMATNIVDIIRKGGKF